MFIWIGRGIAVGKSRSVVDVRRDERPPRQRPLPSDVQRVPLVVIEQTEAVTKRKIGKAAVDVAESKRELIRVGQVNLPAVVNARRPQRQFPAIDARALNCDREEYVRVIQIVVVEEILRQRLKSVRVDCPSK